MHEPLRTIAITGAGSGFGRELALLYARKGYRVGVTDIDGGRTETVMQEIAAAGGDGFAMQLDVTSDQDWSSLRSAVCDRWGALDILVNNAGVAAAGRLEETPLADWQWILDINLMGVVRGCHHFLPMMRARKSGHIVNVASFAGLASMPQFCAYGTAKSAVVALSELLRAELQGTGIGVSVACPSFVQTNLLDGFRSPDSGYRERVERWMRRSSISAGKVAELIHDAVCRGRFLVLTHPETRWAWRMKRWLPEYYFHKVARLSRKIPDKAA